MKIVIGTLVLNEMEWLPKLVEQHQNWPGLVKWVFVESADATYAKTNPTMVTSDGLSVDGTTQFLEKLAKSDSRFAHVKYGEARARRPEQAKCGPRTAYLQVSDSFMPDAILVLDADEFYGRDDQYRVNDLTEGSFEKGFDSICLRQRHVWSPPSTSHDSMFNREAIGGFWNIPHCRVWKWRNSMTYRDNHNIPTDAKGYDFSKSMLRLDVASYDVAPQCVHMGYASKKENREAKCMYYEDRGEKVDKKRSWYTEARRQWLTWKPEDGDSLVHRGRVIPYDGPIPECFNDVVG